MKVSSARKARQSHLRGKCVEAWGVPEGAVHSVEGGSTCSYKHKRRLLAISHGLAKLELHPLGTPGHSRHVQNHATSRLELLATLTV